MSDRLHGLDRRIEGLRRRIWLVRHGLVPVADQEEEVARLQAEFEAAGQEFVATYRAWSEQHDEE